MCRPEQRSSALPLAAVILAAVIVISVAPLVASALLAILMAACAAALGGAIFVVRHLRLNGVRLWSPEPVAQAAPIQAYPAIASRTAAAITARPSAVIEGLVLRQEVPVDWRAS